MNEKAMPTDVVEDGEQIARIIFSPSMIDGDEIAPSAFNLETLKSGTSESYVSVDRMTYRKPLRQYFPFAPRHIGDSMSGYAWMLAREARSASLEGISIDVTPHPSHNNPYHAGISYEQNGKLIKGEYESAVFLAVTSRLAKVSRFVEF